MPDGKRIKIIRSSTVPRSLNICCRGLLAELSKDGYEVIAVSSRGEGLDEIRAREGVRTEAVDMNRRISPFADLRSLIRLYRLMLRERPTMVHSITPKAGLLCMMAAWFARVPVRIHTFTGLVFPTANGILRHILMLTDRITCACATHVVPEGEGVKSDLLSHRITRKPLRVLGHGNIRGIDLQYYDRTPEVESRAAELRRPDLFTFIYAGRIVADKGIKELIQAFTRLNAEQPATRLILVGEYEDHIDPIDKLTRKSIDSHPAITATGYQNDVRPWLACADALAFPSYREGFPNVVIEAGAMGLPAVVTDINGSREIIIDGRNGLIVPPHDPHALYNAMSDMIRQPDITASMAAEARPLVASRYEQNYVRKCLRDYYNEILGSHVQKIR